MIFLHTQWQTKRYSKLPLTSHRRSANPVQGASNKELVLEASRRNNTDLLHDVFKNVEKQFGKKAAASEIASLLNRARDGIGSGVLHIAAAHGNYEVLDMLLDQEGLEIDEPDRLDRDTPLHRAVRYVNGLDRDEWEHGLQVVEILLDAGCDPRIRNKAKLKPAELADPRNGELRMCLQKAEYGLQVGDDVVAEDEDDEEDAGPPSDDE